MRIVFLFEQVPASYASVRTNMLITGLFFGKIEFYPYPLKAIDSARISMIYGMRWYFQRIIAVSKPYFSLSQLPRECRSTTSNYMM